MSNWLLILKLMGILFLYGFMQNIAQDVGKRLAKKCQGFSARGIALLVGGSLVGVVVLLLFALWIKWVAS